MNAKYSITYLLHGFNVRDGGKETVERMRPSLQIATKGSLKSWRYGWFGLFSVIFKNKEVAKKIKENQKTLKEGLIFGVGHSNGCAILAEAAKQGAKFNRLLLINPALKVNTKFADTIDEIIIVHTNNDKPTKAARFFNKVPFARWFIPNAWGAMGSDGYKGDDPRIINIDLTNVLDGHSDIFKAGKISRIGPLLAKALYNSKVPRALFTLK